MSTYVDGQVVLVKAREVLVGDVVVSINFAEIDKDDPDTNMYEWSASTLTLLTIETSKVLGKVQSVHPRVVYFNDDVTATFSETQPILVLRDAVYEWYTVATLMIGDILFKYDRATNKIVPVVLAAVNYVEGATDTYNFSIEDYDVLLAGGYVVHNK